VHVNRPYCGRTIKQADFLCGEGQIMVLRSEGSALTSVLRLRLGNRQIVRHADPQHRSIVVVDIAGYGRRDDPGQVQARARLDRVVRTAFRSSGLPWHRLVVKDRGDGMIVLGRVSKL